MKSAPARVRVDEEIEIDEARFASLWKLSEGRRIVKTRYLIEHDGATIELDDYHDALAGLMTAEIEFPPTRQATRTTRQPGSDERSREMTATPTRHSQPKASPPNRPDLHKCDGR